MKTKIGVFDSGVGGRTTLAELEKLLPEAEFCYIADTENHPYGDKSEAELEEATTAVVAKLAEWGAELVVIACNTATTRCIRKLRQKFPEIIFVGTEPAIKVAVDAGCERILVLATPNTVNSRQVQRLLEKYVGQQEVVLWACPGLAEAVERGADGALEVLEGILADLPELEKFDGVVLGCTHYVLLREEIQQFFPDARIFDGNLGVARRVQALISDKVSA